MPRRGKGEGSIRRRKDGRWEGAFTVGATARGWPKRVSVYGRTRQEVAAKLAELAAKYHKGLFAQPQTLTVGEWASAWLDRKAADIRPSTLAMYRHEVSLALPTLGTLRLQAVQPVHIRHVLDGLAGQYATRTVRMVRQRLHQLFEEALTLELIYRNPAAPVKVKASNNQRIGRSLQPSEVGRLLEALDRYNDARISLVIRLILTLGLRKGEALGLQWPDVDFERGSITIQRTSRLGQTAPTKTVAGQRTLPLPPDLAQRIRSYRESFDLPGLAWVFPGKDPNKPLDYNTPNHTLRRLCQRLGLPPVRIHDLRHTYGSLLLAKGAPVELVSRRMGHANPNITLGVYRHLLEHEEKQWVLEAEELAKE